MNTTAHTSYERANAESDLPTSRFPRGEGRRRIDYDARYHNRSLSTKALLDLLADAAPDFYHRAEVVGAWVWIQFPTKQPPAVTALLAEFGFHWNNKRQVWQHPCGRETQTPFDGDPRERYGSTFPSETAN